ncbi:hypothetical protein CoNPh11_CDS0055 [Staphylococcus phage S-CoN_Ph11]|nr:hypothetical protein CoNPh1_CDS0133 [Staphylococcus phage S-CoN_Ph1]WNM51582.1 hypothetical protein CoNPh2_CDS0027 [Staphylococcus phage S-CoN_Ph2]WNM51743.1 hypothetical protein CoNPh3_CDS0028 [Staphylococcus phage S-CoN_Ph3]WNM52020.1 hypothetical protein CoNPh4_CDS0145 [Staphylococcus phage S-CoN_Ph4]WNM52197.1 hypothetical protein CoNPh5_CDS0152 [Staphylococcus phage S-CoN_Ph5]WNM52239.1 hypothetical protein CoNPh6_CDS0028 [Staphylococcus phage S-CoN_Ph6]WNM52404.1 hypothetical protein
MIHIKDTYSNPVNSYFTLIKNDYVSCLFL